LFDRIQLVNGPPGNFGDSSNFSGEYTFSSFESDPTNASNPSSIFSAADDIPTDEIIPTSLPGQLTATTFAETLQNSYFATDINENPLSFATNPDGSNRFAGQTTQGIWNFQIQDQNANNVGSFTGVTINFLTSGPAGPAVIPEPSSACLLALGGCFLLRRRKKI